MQGFIDDGILETLYRKDEIPQDVVEFFVTYFPDHTHVIVPQVFLGILQISSPHDASKRYRWFDQVLDCFH